ncbi:MAG: PilZ domain-containing protein [Acidobacteriota bacterium]|nr:PilZ domain-containing protein [Acidobacteriota bacterium]
MTKKTLASKKAAPAKKKKSVPADLEINRRREWRFDLPLNVVIEGKLPHGAGFKETTQLENISSSGAYFCLDSGVIVGSKLKLIIDLPKELTEGEKMNLFLGGITVRLEEPNQKNKKQGVAVRFNKEFKFRPPANKSKPEC